VATLHTHLANISIDAEPATGHIVIESVKTLGTYGKVSVVLTPEQAFDLGCELIRLSQIEAVRGLPPRESASESRPEGTD
jgi:hypothetical protein